MIAKLFHVLTTYKVGTSSKHKFKNVLAAGALTNNLGEISSDRYQLAGLVRASCSEALKNNIGKFSKIKNVRSLIEFPNFKQNIIKVI